MKPNEPTQAEIDLVHIVEQDFFNFCKQEDCQTCPYASTLQDKRFNCHTMYIYQRLKEVEDAD